MVKKAKTPAQKLHAAVTAYPKEYHKTALNHLWCKLCNKGVSYDKSHSISSHRSSETHKDKLQNSEKVDTSVPISKAYFPYDLVTTFLSIDIPLISFDRHN